MSADTPSPMLALFERVAGTALGATAGAGSGGAAGIPLGPVRLLGAETAPDAVTLRLRVGTPGGLLDTELRVRLTVTTVTAETTHCTVDFPSQGRLGKLLGAGLQAAPARLVQEALAKRLGGAVTWQQDALVLHHAELVQRLRAKR